MSEILYTTIEVAKVAQVARATLQYWTKIGKNLRSALSTSSQQDRKALGETLTATGSGIRGTASSVLPNVNGSLNCNGPSRWQKAVMLSRGGEKWRFSSRGTKIDTELACVKNWSVVRLAP
jgi:hypothetical protein